MHPLSRRILRRLLTALAIGTGVTVALLGISRIGLFAALLNVFEAKTFDYRMARYRGATVPAGTALDDVVIVDIDEPSLAELGQFFRWPRYYHAALVDSLTAAGVRAIGFDILFPEAESMPAAVAEHYARRLAPAPGEAEALRRLFLKLGSDGAFGEAAQRSGRVVFGVQVSFAEGDSAAAKLVLPIAEIAAGGKGLGHVQIVPDADGIVRRVPAFVRAGEKTILALGVRLALEALSRESAPFTFDPARGMRGSDWFLPTDAAGDILLDYAGPPGTFLRVSYADALRGRVNWLLFKDRVVLIGATASGLMDYFSTPFSPHYPGVEIHATLIHDILHGRFVAPASRLWEGVGLWLVSLLACLAVLNLRPVRAVAVCCALMGGYMLICFERFAAGGVWADLILPLAGWMGAAASASAYRYWSEERSKLAIKRAFSRYLAPQVVEEIAAYPERLGLGGDQRQLTIGFVDIRDFTTLSEGMAASRLAHFLNDYLSEMTATILEQEGTVDKYIGDAIMMLFGAPNPMEDQAIRGCRTALAMRRVVAAQARWQEHGLEELRIGVGLNTGVAIVGNMGSSFRFDYTAMGDSVNLASRLEGLNKVYGTDIILGPETAARAGREFALRELDLVRVKGRFEPARIYELLGEEDGARGEMQGCFVEGLAHFRRREWEEARRAFTCCLRMRPGDGPAQYYLKRIDWLLANPPAADWEGITVMETK